MNRIYAVNVGNGSTLKRVLQIGRTIALVADNTDKRRYPSREINLDEVEPEYFKIIGEVIWWGGTGFFSTSRATMEWADEDAEKSL